MSETSDPTTLGEAFVSESRRQLAESVALIRHCLGQLDDDEVWRRPRDDMNSIANLLLHLAGNLRQRFQAVIAGDPDDRNRFGEFTERSATPKADLLGRFEDSAGKADAVLAKLAPDQLVETRSYMLLAGSEEKSVLGIVIQALTHLNGHAQEILHLTRMQLGDRYAFRQPGGVPPEMRTNRG
ncbi:MAG: DUF1572 family protein [Paludisphaera borealis]|uniref:DUF1572 family protein n=1 Tax=Paludisphaera borealis TaxID=1387353 RepID=UPI0028455D36|nr:DUF1572 family protein [Paludisphaera borealis]MDR3621753.1 DUF1572 family protein [Paludisphaera borealis]